MIKEQELFFSPKKLKELENILINSYSQEEKIKEILDSLNKKKNLEDLWELTLLFSRIVRLGNSYTISKELSSFWQASNQELDYDFTSLNIPFSLFLLALSKADEKVIFSLLQEGSDEERALIHRALIFLPDAKKFSSYIVDNCRTNSLVVFSSISQKNYYPFFYFSDNEFIQLTLKTIFLDLDFSLIYALEERYTDKLGEKIKGLYEERQAAGRDLPVNVINFLKQKNLL